jgi:hypothetical protein
MTGLGRSRLQFQPCIAHTQVNIAWALRLSCGSFMGMVQLRVTPAPHKPEAQVLTLRHCRDAGPKSPFAERKTIGRPHRSAPEFHNISLRTQRI